jgi:hypothetical protein
MKPARLPLRLLLLVPLLAVGLTIVVALPAAALAQSGPAVAEAERIVTDLQKGTRLQRTMAAIALRHFVARQSSFRLLASTEPRWWQTTLAPVAPRLVQMLGDESGLEWVDQNGMPEGTTTPRKEAAQALISLQRPAVDPLLARLDDPKIGPRAAEVLLRILPEGPTGGDPTAWKAWWTQHQQEPLVHERGQLAFLIIRLVLLGLGVTLVVLAQRWMVRRGEAARRRSRAALP